MDKLTNYLDWRNAITKHGGFTLDRAYCEARIAELQDRSLHSTKSLVDYYGEEYCELLISWFKQALSEA